MPKATNERFKKLSRLSLEGITKCVACASDLCLTQFVLFERRILSRRARREWNPKSTEEESVGYGKYGIGGSSRAPP